MPRFRARLLTPVSPDQALYLEDALVEVEAGRLVRVEPWDGGLADQDLRPGLLAPGFVDAHLHFPQTRIVGAATGPLLAWLARSTYPEEQRFAEPSHAEAVARIFLTATAAAGTTLALAYGSVHPAATHALLAEADRRGLRLIAGPVLMDENCPEALRLPVDRAIPALEELAETWHGKDGRLEVAVVPRFAVSCSMPLMAAAGELARRRGLWATTHLSESPAECDSATTHFGTADYLAVYEAAGLVHERSIFAHCIHLSQSEWDRFAAAGAVVAHCPDSNFFLGSGRMPVAEVRGRGIPVAMGTDVAAGRSFRVPRILSSAYDNALATGVELDPRQLLWWGTRGGALALQHEHVGALQAGLEADMALYELPEWVDTEDEALAWLIFDHDAPRPLKTWVRGEVVWERQGGSFPWA